MLDRINAKKCVASGYILVVYSYIVTETVVTLRIRKAKRSVKEKFGACTNGAKRDKIFIRPQEAGMITSHEKQSEAVLKKLALAKRSKTW